MEIIEVNGKEYIKMHQPSVAEYYGLVPKGSTPPLLFPVVGYAEDPSGKLVCLLYTSPSPRD